MDKRFDARVDAYIEKAAPFAQPILRHIREVMHRIDPGMGEGIKWGMPFFIWGGQPLANMAAFKAHAAFGFWKREGAESRDAMGQFGRLTSVADLPGDDALTALARAEMALLESGAKTARRAPAPKAEIAMPGDFAAALAQAGHGAAYEAMPPGARREYLEWITGAKQEATRARRIATAVAQIGEGRKLNWKYEKC